MMCNESIYTSLAGIILSKLSAFRLSDRDYDGANVAWPFAKASQPDGSEAERVQRGGGETVVRVLASAVATTINEKTMKINGKTLKIHKKTMNINGKTMKIDKKNNENQ